MVINKQNGNFIFEARHGSARLGLARHGGLLVPIKTNNINTDERRLKNETRKNTIQEHR